MKLNYRNLILLSASFAIFGVQAGNFVSPAVTIDIDDTKKTITVGGKSLSISTEEVVVETEPNASVELRLTNLNRVLYNYNEAELITTPTANAAALKTFFEALSNLIPEDPDKSAIGGQQLKKITAFKNFSDGICPNGVVLQIEDIDVVTMIDNIRPLGSKIVEELNFALDLTGQNKIELAKKHILTEKLAQLTGTAAKAIMNNEILHTLSFSKGTLNVKYCSAPAGELISISNLKLKNSVYKKYIETLELIQSLKPSLVETIELVNDAIKAIEGSGVGSSFVAKKIHMTNTENQSLVAKVTNNKSFDEFLSKNLIGNKSPSIYKIKVSPKEYFTFKLSGGAFYSFVDSADYGTEKKDDKFVITESDNRKKGVNGMIAMNISYAKYKYSIGKPFLQVGAVIDKNNFGVALGAGISAFDDKALFSIGVIYQKIERLANGLSIGQQLEKLDELKVKDDYKAGLYIGINSSF